MRPPAPPPITPPPGDPVNALCPLPNSLPGDNRDTDTHDRVRDDRVDKSGTVTCASTANSATSASAEPTKGPTSSCSSRTSTSESSTPSPANYSANSPSTQNATISHEMRKIRTPSEGSDPPIFCEITRSGGQDLNLRPLEREKALGRELSSRAESDPESAEHLPGRWSPLHSGEQLSQPTHERTFEFCPGSGEVQRPLLPSAQSSALSGSRRVDAAAAPIKGSAANIASRERARGARRGRRREAGPRLRR